MEIKELVSVILEDVKTIRESDMTAKERLPLEIMALNAISNAQKSEIIK